MKTMRLMTFSGRRIRAVRLLTLLCFFHFSGLNNGFSFLIVSPDKVESANFAPVLIERVAGVFNPASWVRAVQSGEWIDLLTRQTRVLEISSQNVIGSILEESTLFQTWLNYSLRSAVPSENSVRDRAPAADRAAIGIDLSGYGRSALVFSEAAAVLSQGNSGAWVRIKKMDLNGSEKLKGIDPSGAWTDAAMRAPDECGMEGGRPHSLRRGGGHSKDLVLGSSGRKLGEPAILLTAGRVS